MALRKREVKQSDESLGRIGFGPFQSSHRKLEYAKPVNIDIKNQSSHRILVTSFRAHSRQL